MICEWGPKAGGTWPSGGSITNSFITRPNFPPAAKTMDRCAGSGSASFLDESGQIRWCHGQRAGLRPLCFHLRGQSIKWLQPSELIDHLPLWFRPARRRWCPLLFDFGLPHLAPNRWRPRQIKRLRTKWIQFSSTLITGDTLFVPNTSRSIWRRRGKWSLTTPGGSRPRQRREMDSFNLQRSTVAIDW